uniref:EGF-like domain-containing protein n=1 Tax=Hippocampus comes TaxID=109280 RepID=A0A3Q3D368_HIPCM
SGKRIQGHFRFRTLTSFSSKRWARRAVGVTSAGWVVLLSHCFLGAEQSRSCCKNGGTCILGSFCACPPFFTGRSCEYNQRIRRCGPVPHGEWVRKGCSYCRCGYGLLHCFPRVFHKDCGMDATHYYYHYYLVRSVSGGLCCFPKYKA